LVRRGGVEPPCTGATRNLASRSPPERKPEPGWYHTGDSTETASWPTTHTLPSLPPFDWRYLKDGFTCFVPWLPVSVSWSPTYASQIRAKCQHREQAGVVTCPVVGSLVSILPAPRVPLGVSVWFRETPDSVPGLRRRVCSDTPGMKPFLCS